LQKFIILDARVTHRILVFLSESAGFLGENLPLSTGHVRYLPRGEDGAAVLRFAIMGRVGAFVRAAIAAAGLVLALATPAFAQSPSPAPKGGLCAPWHHCLAYLTLGLVVLYLLLTAGMYVFQRRGFDNVEHRQGNPEGVPTKKE
jgi:hypothetical protein